MCDAGLRQGRALLSWPPCARARHDIALLVLLIEEATHMQGQGVQQNCDRALCYQHCFE